MDDILIVGAGPVGLSLAVNLVHEGIPVTVIEKESDVPVFPKASTVHPPTLELLNEWGLLGKLEEIGRVADYIQYWKRSSGTLIAEFDLDLLKEFTPFPYRLHVDQQFVTRTLLDYLVNNDLADVRYNHELVELQPNADEVTVTVRNPEGEEQLNCSYLIGADGLSSTVRKKLGISFSGHTNPHYHLLMGLKNFGIESKYSNLGPVAMFLDSDEWVDLISNLDMLKVIIPVTESRTEDFDDHFIRLKMKEVGIVREGFDIFYKTVYKTHQLVAERMVNDRVILIGDAAHVNVEFGGMGMNSGIHDAHLLATKLSLILNGADPVQHLADFEERRMRVNKEVVQRDTIRNTNLIANVEQYEHELRELAADAEKSKKYLLRTSMIEGYQLMLKGLSHTVY